MEETIKIHCENTGSELHVKPGTTLSEVLSMLALKSKSETPFLAAYVNNRLKELYYRYLIRFRCDLSISRTLRECGFISAPSFL